MDYEKTVAALFERHQSVQSVGFSPQAYKPGLGGMEALAAAAGNPQRGLRCIHVAGTNGKGSVCSMLAAALSAAGLRTGLYTSPHLLDFRERMKTVEGGTFAMIPREDVLEFLESFGNYFEGRSFFEITTAMAFWWFARQKVDVAVIETGLGGRLDSTNIITPEISIITGIGLDHCAILGGTREEIASEKAGIFKPGVPALVGEYDPVTGPVLESRAAQVHCPLFFASDAPLPDASAMDLRGPCCDLNLRTVLCALEILGIDPDQEALSGAARITGFRGRWERLLTEPELICDIGHNPPALEHNFARLEASGRPLVIVYGVMADKDIDSILPLMPRRARYVPVAPATSRSLPADALALKMRNLDCSAPASSVAEGVETALKMASEAPGTLIYVGGSTFVVSEAISYIETLKQQ